MIQLARASQNGNWRVQKLSSVVAEKLPERVLKSSSPNDNDESKLLLCRVPRPSHPLAGPLSMLPCNPWFGFSVEEKLKIEN
jgi:hypothetical protein